MDFTIRVGGMMKKGERGERKKERKGKEREGRDFKGRDSKKLSCSREAG